MHCLDTETDLLKALAHPTRLRIVQVLAGEEACVCHLTAVTGQRQANISQHLTVLRAAGLVQDRRDGVLVYYRLADPRLWQALALLCEVACPACERPLGDIPHSPVPGCPCPKCRAQDGAL